MIKKIIYVSYDVMRVMRVGGMMLMWSRTKNYSEDCEEREDDIKTFSVNVVRENHVVTTNTFMKFVLSSHLLDR